MPGVDEVMEKVSLGRNEMCQRLEEAQPGSKGNHCTEEGIGEGSVDEAECWGAARGRPEWARVWGLMASHLCPLHRLDHTQQANFCPHPTPTDGGSQETCSGGRMNLAH